MGDGTTKRQRPFNKKRSKTFKSSDPSDCPYCGAELPNKVALNKHIFVAHVGKKTVKVKKEEREKAEAIKKGIADRKFNRGASKEEKSLPTDDIHAAILYMEEIFESAHLPYVALGDLAKCVYAQRDVVYATKLKYCVKQKHLTRYAVKTLQQIVSDFREITREDKNFVTKHRGVPIIIRVLDKDYRIFTNPDKRFYSVIEVPLPNPFDLYLEKYKFLQ